MTTNLADSDDTNVLLSKAAQGDADALHRVLGKHRDRLKRMVGLRLSTHATARGEASEVVEETLFDAASKLAAYVRDRPIPFFPWLHRLAAERLALNNRRYAQTEVGDARRIEEAATFVKGPSPSPPPADQAVIDETARDRDLVRKRSFPRIRLALEKLPPLDREVLVMLHMEGLTFTEIAAILGIEENQAKTLHLRALRKARALIDDAGLENRR